MKKVKSRKWLIGFMVVGLSLGIVNILHHQGVTQAKDSGESISPIPQEVVSKRTEYSKTYANGDGTFTLKTHLAPIHYQNKNTGQFEPIELNIIRASKIPLAAQSVADVTGLPSPETYAFSDEKNVIHSYFKERSTEGNLFRAEVGDNYITWQPLSIKLVDSEGNTEEISSTQDVQAFSQQNKITYLNIFPDIDEEFIALPGKIKDNIILHGPPNPSSLTGFVEFAIEGMIEASDGLSFFVNGVKQTSDFFTNSAIEIRGSSDNTVMSLVAPFAYERINQQERIKSIYHVKYIDGKIYLAIKTSTSWLSDPEREYPIIIDPTLVLDVGKDTYICEGFPSTNYCNENVLNVAPVFDYSLIGGFDITFLPANAVIDNVTLNLYVSKLEGTAFNISACQITENWAVCSVTWNIGNPLHDCSKGVNQTCPSSGWCSFDVYDLVNEWLSDPMLGIYGFYLKRSTSVVGAYSFNSSDSGSNIPYLNIEYHICDCTSGPCCDGCNYRPSSYKCQEDVTTEYGCPSGTDCGDDVSVRHQDRYCSGSSSSCNGSLVWGSWIAYDNCTSTETCSPGDSTCNYTASCDCDCSSGACCDGCNYRSSSYKCNEDVITEFYCKDGTNCGQDVYVRHQDQYCSGSSSSCSGALQWGTPVVYDNCTSTETCSPGDSTCNYTASCDGDGNGDGEDGEENGGCQCNSIGNYKPIDKYEIIGWFLPFLIIAPFLLLLKIKLRNNSNNLS